MAGEKSHKDFVLTCQEKFWLSSGVWGRSQLTWKITILLPSCDSHPCLSACQSGRLSNSWSFKDYTSRFLHFLPDILFMVVVGLSSTLILLLPLKKFLLALKFQANSCFLSIFSSYIIKYSAIFRLSLLLPRSSVLSECLFSSLSVCPRCSMVSWSCAWE